VLLVVRSAELGPRDLLHEVLVERTGVPPRVDRTCPDCGAQHGKPVLEHPTLHVSTADSGGLSVVAVTDAGPVGVDVEQVDRSGFPGFAEVALGLEEHASDLRERTVLWTRKEAVLKATGEGLRTDPRTVDVGDPARPAGREHARGAELFDVPAPEGWVVSAAVLTERRPVLETRVR
jgi:4'-phosphopantetheinyl transferase